MTIKTSLQNQAYQSIRQQIIYADLEPGKKVSEKKLEETLSIGRTPIREALIQLRHQGLVDTIPQSGNYISLIDLDLAKNARFVREHLERQIMLECCAKMNNQKKQVLETIIAEQEKAVSQKNARSFFHNDIMIIYFIKLVLKLQNGKKYGNGWKIIIRTWNDFVGYE